MSNRWIILITGVLANLCVGATYAFSVFAKPMMSMFNWSPSEVALLFTILLGMMPISMMIAGKMQDLQGPKVTFLVAGAVYGIGWFFSGYATSLMYLYIVFGVVCGLSQGAIYSCTVVNTIKWFPDKRGLATGLISAGLGGGAIFAAPGAAYLIQTQGLLPTFKIFGVLFFVVCVGAALCSATPPPGYKPAGWKPPAPSNTSIVSTGDKTWKEMMSDPMFYLLWVLFVLCAISGLMVISQASAIGQEIVKLTPAKAALAVSFLAMANTLGRIVWGWVSDKIGRYNTMTAMFIVSAIAMFVLNRADTFEFFIVELVLIASCYGGFFALFPPTTGDMFGMKNLGINWGVMFTAFAPAAIIGPMLAAKVKMANNGDYSLAFMVAASLCVVGALLTIYAQNQMKKRRKLATAVEKSV